MQSIFINSQINYTESDRNIIEYNKDKKNIMNIKEILFHLLLVKMLIPLSMKQKK
jgi:hypothetical protein